jgi:hypothetical protein
LPGGQGKPAALVVNLLDAKLASPNPIFSVIRLEMGLAGLTELSARAYAGSGIRVCGIAPSVTLCPDRRAVKFRRPCTA